MASSENEASCESDPNFAVICGFLNKFGFACGLANVDFFDLQEMLENTQEVPQQLIDLHVKLLRKARKTVSSERWERGIVNFCHGFCSQDAWEIERFGYKKVRLSAKLRLLKELLELQFDCNSKFKSEVNKLSAEELRTQPLGKDRLGHAYWYQTDENCQIRVYKEDPDEESWALVVKDRDGLVSLITELSDGKISQLVNEDSSSLESGKPVVDTGQTDSGGKSEVSNSEENTEDGIMKSQDDSCEDTDPLQKKTDSDPLEDPLRDESNEEFTQETEDSNEAVDYSNSAKSDEQNLSQNSVQSVLGLRIKPISELISGTNLEVPKKELVGVKEKYIRSDPPTSLTHTIHRKAIDSAGYDVHKNYLKRPLNDEEDVEEPSYLKRPRSVRPSLLSNKKKPESFSDEEEVLDEVEEPLMLVQGMGSGQENNEVNRLQTLEDDDSVPLVGSEIEEPVMFVYGEGSGAECQAGNEEKDKPKGNSSSNESSSSSSIKETLGEGAVEKTIPIKSSFKLGTIVDVRSNQFSAFKNVKSSRWDVGKPAKLEDTFSKMDTVQEKVLDVGCAVESTPNSGANINFETEKQCGVDKEEDQTDFSTKNESLEVENEVSDAKKPIFFFGPGSLQTRPNLNQKFFGFSKTYLSNTNNSHNISAIIKDNVEMTPHITRNETPMCKASTSQNIPFGNECIGKEVSVDKTGEMEFDNNLNESLDLTSRNSHGDSKSEDVASCSETSKILEEHVFKLPCSENIESQKTNVKISLDKETQEEDKEITNIPKTSPTPDIHEELDSENIGSTVSQKMEENLTVPDKLDITSNIKETNSNFDKNQQGLSKLLPSRPEEPSSLKTFMVENILAGKDKYNKQDYGTEGKISVTDETLVEDVENKQTVLEMSNLDVKAEADATILDTDLTSNNNRIVVDADLNQNTSRIEKGEDAVVKSTDSSVALDNKTDSLVASLIHEKLQIPIKEVMDDEGLKSKRILDSKVPLIEQTTTEVVEQHNRVNADTQIECTEDAAPLNLQKKHPSSELITNNESHVNILNSMDGKECNWDESDIRSDGTVSKEEDGPKVLQVLNDSTKPESELHLSECSQELHKSVQLTTVDHKETVNDALQEVAPTGTENGSSGESNRIHSVAVVKDNISEVPETNQNKVDQVANEIAIQHTHEECTQKRSKTISNDSKIDTSSTTVLEPEEIDKNLSANSSNVIENVKNDEVDHLKLMQNQIGNIEIGNVTDSKDNHIEDLVSNTQEEKEIAEKRVTRRGSKDMEASEEQQDLFEKINNEEITKGTCKRALLKKNTENALENDVDEDTIVDEDSMKPDIDIPKENNISVDDGDVSPKRSVHAKNTIVDEKADDPEELSDAEICDIEDQIESYEVRPSKKLKLSEKAFSDTIVVDEIKPVDHNEPVVEPKCVEKKVPLIMCVDVNEESSNKLNENSDSDSDRFGGDFSLEEDPLALKDDNEGSDEDQPQAAPMTLSSFKLDHDDDDEELSANAVKITRKRAAEQSIDSLVDAPDDNKNKPKAGKRPKLKGKSTANRNLRKSIEEQKRNEVSSSEEEDNNEKKTKGVKDKNSESSPIHSSDSPSEATRTDQGDASPVQKKARARKKKTLLGLDIPDEADLVASTVELGVRQSRRIAQIKIKEAERKEMEELAFKADLLKEHKHKSKKNEDEDYKGEKRKRKSKEVGSEEDTETVDADSDEKKKRKRKRKNMDPRKFDSHNPWKSSSGSSSSEVDDDEEEPEDDDDHPLVFKSDHEFSPESDLEGDLEIQPLKRARTARKESDDEEDIDDCACQKCGKKDHPEWILLCDSCDSGWHCSCLRPALLVIPEGDWFCPPCQHQSLVRKLEMVLSDHDKKVNKREMEFRRKQRLAYVGISLDNVLPSKDVEEIRHKHKRKEEEKEEDEHSTTDESESGESNSQSESGSASESDSDEPIYQLRQRRQAQSYKFNDYDELINSAIQDEMEAVKGAGNQGRGKDIATIVNAEKEEIMESETKTEEVEEDEDEEEAAEPLPPVVPNADEKVEEAESDDDEPIRPVRKKIIGRKKHRKLNSLDISSEDDEDSDEDFKGTSSDSDEEEDVDEELSTESSDDIGGRYKRRKNGPVRRSTRARISRYDRDFINDDSESEEAPRRKKSRGSRGSWDSEEEESEESDNSWGRKKKRKSSSRNKKPTTATTTTKAKKKKKRPPGDSDAEYKKGGKRRIKYGGLKDDYEDDREEIGRRTRGKKINYLDALGTDSDDDVRRKPVVEESEDEYDVTEEKDQVRDSDESVDEEILTSIREDLSKNPPRIRSKGRGKSGLKIPRKPKPIPQPEEPSDINMKPPESLTVNFAAMDLPKPNTSDARYHQNLSLIEQDIEDEPNPIEQMNKNLEQMDEREMEKMMEEEDYANKQLHLVALQLEKEKKRREREAQKIEQPNVDIEQKVPKRRGRKPKNKTDSTPLSLFNDSAAMMMDSAVPGDNAELSEPPGLHLPMFSELMGVNEDKKLMEENCSAEHRNPVEHEGTPENVATASPLRGSKLGIVTPPQPFSQNQPTPSVITRMLQAPPNTGNFPPGSKFFLGDQHPGTSATGPPVTYHSSPLPPRGPAPPYQVSSGPFQRAGPPLPHRQLNPNAAAMPLYHTHRSLDPSPSGGGPINLPNISQANISIPPVNRDRNSPLAGSPMGKAGESVTPPPAYARHFTHPTGTNARRMPVPPHLMHRGPVMSPYHPGVPSGYHYGSYPPGEEVLQTDMYQNQAYPEGFTGREDEPPEEGSAHAVNAKQFEEEGDGGEFGGLVSYFSSQREDELNS